MDLGARGNSPRGDWLRPDAVVGFSVGIIGRVVVALSVQPAVGRAAWHGGNVLPDHGLRDAMVRQAPRVGGGPGVFGTIRSGRPMAFDLAIGRRNHRLA